ncbi:MAG: hypothetical protein AAFR74_01110 [Pseudomonadota bacterium]
MVKRITKVIFVLTGTLTLGITACTTTQPSQRSDQDMSPPRLVIKQVETVITSFETLPDALYTADKRDLMEDLLGKDASAQTEAINTIAAAPQEYPPYFFYMMSDALFDQNKKDEAAFWFYAGQLRSRYDANRCGNQLQGRNTVDMLNQEYGTPINQYTFKDVDNLSLIVERVIAFEKQTPHDYDPKWVFFTPVEGALMPVDPDITPNTAKCLPQKDWPAMNARTVREYQEGFEQALAMIR